MSSNVSNNGNMATQAMASVANTTTPTGSGTGSGRGSGTADNSATSSSTNNNNYYHISSKMNSPSKSSSSKASEVVSQQQSPSSLTSAAGSSPSTTAPTAGTTTTTAGGTTTTAGTTASNIISSNNASSSSNSNSAGTSSFTNTNNNTTMKKKDYIWEWKMDKIRAFIQQSDLFPRNVQVDKKNKEGNISNPTTASPTSTKSSIEKTNDEEYYQKQCHISNILLNNFCLALQSASIESKSNQSDDKYYDEHDHKAKRQKIEPCTTANTTTTTTTTTSSSDNIPIKKRDLYNILDSSFSRGVDVIHEPGTIISRMTLNGFINALAGRIGGLVDVNIHVVSNSLADIILPQLQPLFTMTTPIPTASNLTFKEIQHKATNLYYNIRAQLEIDMLESTPIRIINLLCPELSLAQVSSIRHRVVETVIHGRGTNTSNFLYSLEDDNQEDIPTMAKSTSMQQTHEINKFKRCKVCNNNDQGGNGFVLDKKNGDVICTVCGTVISESLMHEGSMYRKFEGEEDRNHHGDASNPLYSNAYNMATSLSGVSVSVGAGMGGIGSKGKGNIETILKRVHNYTEMNISQMGKEERKTRIGYKDRQKKEAFVQMNHVGDALSLHQAVLQRAKELFAGFRDDRELLQQFKGVIAACLCEAFDQLSNEGKHLLKMQASGGEDKIGSMTSGEESNQQQGQDSNRIGTSIIRNEKFNARANRRNELHSSNLAGQGGLKLNLPQKIRNNRRNIQNSNDEKKDDGGRTTPKTPTQSDLENKPMTTWTLDDIRTWFMEASRKISPKLFEQQQSCNNNMNTATNTVDEMEGRLVQYTLKICSMLEDEIKKKSLSSKSSSAVITPRLKEMGKLSIKWQHKHERGSGGAGGVGFSGHSIGTNTAGSGRVASTGGNKTAGQILRLKTASQLKKVIGDDVAGEAFYKELRGLVGRQDAKAKKERSEEASIRRMNQMKRKPELQARVQL